ncbi:carbamoyltransferase HypF [Amycolatopsis sp. CA-230715]|uniref:carbamoyltransferase HypF n=1 Tax=Amycolatopsis sp. CA-230715 TaxID=2745196 RepID=UPI001C00DDDC|nr:carbamoyltransferase HypF [Amycolatopsis sp. CA-230715]QWF77937.1 Carbamoyltransferase HypF [Amycolatopsis sp. CA-230715]
MTGPSATVNRVRVEVHGMVQGVGFRPFVHRLATGLGLVGDVRNAGGYVVIRAAGATGPMSCFLSGLHRSAPPHATVDRLEIGPVGEEVALGPGFAVLASGPGRPVVPRVPPDLATCPDCVRELFDPADRRYRYPFLNCTACGPRASIVEGLPYDRARTAMRGFPLCAACRAEYHDPADRRFHAEPIACPACGPRLEWYLPGAGDAPARGEDALTAAVTTISGGGIAAIKGIGGYQLVCDATDDDAVRRLRDLKHRRTKPFAVMARDLASARELCTVDSRAAGALVSSPAPIVLLPRFPGTPIADQVAPGLPELGVFLPYSPVHHLLLDALSRPLVVTSGNRAGEPIAIDDAAARATLGPVTDGLLMHTRPIWSRYDDSVVRPARHGTVTVRRARGLAPSPLPLPASLPAPVLALGAQLKHTAALAIGSTATLGPHTGDLEDADVFSAFAQAVQDLCRTHDVRPEHCAHDLHPAYLSTQYARRWPRTHRIAVQHHHAHVAATAAEHRVPGPFVGIALDGLGLGDDGTFWGGEVLLSSYTGYRRFARFGTAPLPGGAAAVRRPARMALGYLFGAEPSDGPGFFPEHGADLLARLDGHEVHVVRAMIERNVNCPLASSAGRLFDAVAALLGLCDDNRYEGEAAVRLEAAATGHEPGSALRWRLYRRDGMWVYDPVPTLAHAVEAAAAGSAGVVAARFHRTIAEVVVALAEKAADALGAKTVCLGGGVFQNALLTERVLAGLHDAGLRPLAGARVPMNDGGISYGQAAIAAARLGKG